MKRVLSLFAAVLGIVAAVPVLAHSIDYISTDIQPQAVYAGQSGHFQLIDPVVPGQTITFNLTLEFIESGGGATAALPATVTFGVKNTGGPAEPVVKFGTPQTTLTDTAVFTYSKLNNKINAFMTPVTAYAPAIPGSYHFKIQALGGYQGKGFTPGDGIVIHFRVIAPMTTPIPTVLTLTLATPSIVYHAPTSTLIAALTRQDNGAPVPGQTVNFYFDGGTAIPATTDAGGMASVVADTATVGVGDYPVAANFEPAGEYAGSSASTTQCVVYNWLGFLPPVLVQSSATSGLGIGLFQGKVIPVKVKIADYDNHPVPDAQARVYFAKTLTGSAEVVAEAVQPTIADAGNLMRYDPVADQYILNWNISSLPSGDYNVRVFAEEGSCTPGHWSPVRIGKASK